MFFFVFFCSSFSSDFSCFFARLLKPMVIGSLLLSCLFISFFIFFLGQERPNVGTRPYASVFLTPPCRWRSRFFSPLPFFSYSNEQCAFCRAKRKEHAFAGSDRLDSEYKQVLERQCFCDSLQPSCNNTVPTRADGKQTFLAFRPNCFFSPLTSPTPSTENLTKSQKRLFLFFADQNKNLSTN
jgi:hypothetical protein